MSKFIEIHRRFIDAHGERCLLPELVNLDHVDHIAGETGRMTLLYMTEGDNIHVVESYEEVLRLVSKSQGGIPIGGTIGGKPVL